MDDFTYPFVREQVKKLSFARFLELSPRIISVLIRTVILYLLLAAACGSTITCYRNSNYSYGWSCRL
jgi:hypothetical protein